MEMNLQAVLKEVVKEAVREVLAEGGVVASTQKAPVVEKEEKKVTSISNSKSVKNVEKAPVEDKKEVVSSADRKAELDAMGFKDLQVLCKEMGLKAVGGKASLIEKILEAEGVSEAGEEETTPVNDEVDQDENGNEEDNSEPTLYDKIVAGTKEMTDDELREILDSVEISSKGKRQALLTKIVQAVEEGKLEWDDEEGESSDNNDEEETDNSGNEDEVVNSPERAAAMEEIEEQLRTQYKAKEITDKEIADFLDQYHNGTHKGTKAQNLDEYIRIQCALIDEDGEQHDFEEPYYVGEDAYCCGAALKELDGKFVCEVCGTEYNDAD